MAPPRKEEEGEQQQEARGGVPAEDAPRDELAEAMALLGIGQREGAAAVAQFREEAAAVARYQQEEAAEGDHFFPAFMVPYAYASAPALQPTVGTVRGIGPAPPPPRPPPALAPHRDRGMRRGHVLGHWIGEHGVVMAPPSAAARAARGVLHGGHAYMAPPPQLLLHGGAVAFNLLVEDPNLFLPGREQELLLALSREAPETIVGYACKLMHSRHGQRLFRLILKNCDHELREWVVATITRDKKGFWKICAQRSDEVVFMIKSCETRGSFLFLRDAMVPWVAPNHMHSLMSDSNRLRVVQAFVLSSPPDIAPFIFEAVAKNCTRLAYQPNGLSLLQNCLERVSWKEKDYIFTKISYQSLHLAQNSCGNWIVQDVLKSGDLSHFAIIASCLRDNYLGLSRQKYSSNVVEWCLRVFDEGQRYVIVNELITNPHFRDLVTDEFANFVLSTALETCNVCNLGCSHSCFNLRNTKLMDFSLIQFPLRNMLVNAILSHNVNQCNQHCMKIFSILAKSGYIQ